jgi:hypothetical protein
MPTIELLATTGVEQVDSIVRGVISLIELMLPHRVRGYYLTGSYADGSAVPMSDIDLATVVMGVATPEEDQQFADLRAACKLISPCSLDLSLLSEDIVLQSGEVSLKLASVLLYGEDIRAGVPLMSISAYTRQAMHFPYVVFSAMRRNLSILTFPLDYPDPAADYYGYVRRQLRALDGTIHTTTKQLLLTACWTATALVAYKAGTYVSNKRDCLKQYRRWTNDEWAALLEDIDEHCRMRWGYRVPEAAADQEHLRELCQRELVFENHFLTVYQQYLLAELQEPDELTRQFAVERLGQIVYHADAVLGALHEVEQQASPQLRHAVAETVRRYSTEEGWCAG